MNKEGKDSYRTQNCQAPTEARSLEMAARAKGGANPLVSYFQNDTKVLELERYRKSAALAQADQRDAALAVGRLLGGASDGAQLAGHHCITGDLASPPPRPSHVCTPPAPVRASPTAADSTQLTVSSRVCCRCLVPAAHDW